MHGERIKIRRTVTYIQELSLQAKIPSTFAKI
jgi:hypothetical protein